MLNNQDFTKRIERILKFYDLSAAAFADKIGVQRSSISHLLSGRNKPSLEFVMKVTTNFPEVDLHWLLYGKGSFPYKAKNPSPPETETIIPNRTETHKNPATSPRAIDKIIIFYSDGSFKSYTEI